MVDGARGILAAVATGFAEFPAPAGRSSAGQGASALSLGRGGFGAVDGDGPLGWDGYGLARKRAAERTGVDESVVCGRGVVGGRAAVFVAFEFGFLGGSVGTGTGARIVDAFTRARAERLPVVSLIATGGTRMQEGVPALRQLQLIARQAVLLRESGLPHIAVLREPTTGGVWASLGAGADVVLAVRGAQVAFGGRRTRPVATADDSAYTAEAQFAAGYVDEIVESEGELSGLVGEWMSHLATSPVSAADVPRALGDLSPVADGWSAVLRTRSPERPRAGAYLDDYFASRRELRAGRAADGMLCGFGLRDDRAIAYAAQTGTATRPAGFRAATRLVRTADRLGIPVLTLVDTPGAASDPDAEREGVGPALAELFATIAATRVPVTTLVIGEGGSGGALALCSTDRVWIAPNAYFSVIAPELAAGILKRAPDDVPALAGQLRLRPHDLLELGVVDGIAEG
ncbi:carboxyl transferase domain-containing protein [Actinophytocola sp.]|uniref:carboxyl transferase domain-containing protein n=1 Tax=Actinophytocola sp. TaxID=1872138 RepID=UPI002ED4C425